ncbi:MAG TPA: RagB/SusD family nutrient uptake outer membrane protein [Balneolaceae bacterium]|nr:RagB/SusD family nutrient uptake outer membrane protein [Balneolaceae bacterium]
MKKLIVTVLAGCILSGVTACKNNLNLKPENSFSSASVWHSAKLAQTFVNQRYQVLPNLLYGTSALTLWPSVAADAYIRFNYNNASAIQKGELAPDNTTSFAGMGAWNRYWKTIRNCNIFFQKIKGIKGNAALVKRLTGEVHFLRAWSYFELIKRYGGVPIIKKVFKLGGNYKEKRSSYDKCTKFIVADLDSAATDLPVAYSSGSSKLGRASKGAALGLKSRVLLFDASKLNNPNDNMSKWKKAANAAKAVIDLGAYHLYQGKKYSNIFLKNWTSGIIFAREYSSNPNYGWHDIQTVEAPNGYHGWSACSPSQNLVNQFPMKNGKPITASNSGYDPNHPYKNRGPRFYGDIVYNNEMFYGRKTEFYKGGKDSPQGIDNWNASLTKYTLKKYFDQSRKIGSSKQPNTEVPLIRLPEMYLNYAEAEYHLGNESMARQALDKLRERPSINFPDLPSTLSGPKLMAAIRRERRLDLSFEGHHYFDLLRWKLAMKKLNGHLNGMMITKNSDGTFNYHVRHVIPLTFKKKMYRFPIPHQVEEKTDLKQNPGY